MVEGEDLVEAGLAAGLEPVELLVAGENVSAEVLASVSELPHPPRRIAVFQRDDLPRLDPGAAPAVGLALWHVGDPGNVGTIIRSADALGPAFGALSSGSADPTGPKALRASMGAVFRVPLGGFEDAPGRRVALVASGGEPLHQADLSGPVTLGRNTLQGPGLVWGQASLAKEWPIRERLRFNLRFDVNNVYKYHNFFPPNATYNASDPSSFGTFNSTRGSFSDVGTGRWHGIMVFRVMW